jgi:hypothetical protein
MTKIELDEAERKEILRRLHEIRNNDTNPERLQTILQDWDRDYGPKYNDIAVKILHEFLRKNSTAWAKQHGISTAADIVRDMWEGWEEGEFTIERSEDGIKIRCTKCPHADTYLSIGQKEYGLLFKCSEDPPIVLGVSPNIRFSRTKSLMNGDDCCNHHYSDM